MTTRADITIDSNIIFRTLNTPYIVFGVDDPTFTILEENEAHAEVAMVTREDVIGKPLLDVFPDTSEEYRHTGKSPLIESIRKVIKTKKPDAMPRLSYDLRDKTGTYRTKYWSVTHYPILENSTHLIGVLQHTKDITEETLRDQKLQHTETQLNRLLSASQIGTWSLDLKSERVEADINLAHMFGLGKSAVTDGLELSRFIDVIHKEDVAHVTTEIKKAIKSGEPYELEYRLQPRKNVLKWVIARGQVELDDMGQPCRFAGVLIDITDRKRVEEALRDSEQRLQFMADSVPQLVWRARSDGYHEYYNHQWYEFTGAKPGSTFGMEWGDLLHPDDRERTWSAWTNALKSGKPYEIEYRLYHAETESYRWMIGRALPYKSKKGEVLKWYGTCTDIDEQKHAAQIQSFLANASKELSRSLDYKTMINKVTELGIPEIADWCTVDIYDEAKGFQQISMAHVDSSKITLAKQFRDQNPISIDDPSGIPNVIRTGKSEFYPHITNDMLTQLIDDEEKLQFMQSLNLCSIIIAPLRIADTVVGGISFISSDSGRYYTEADLRMAEKLAGHISLAMTNSKLYNDSLKDLENRRKLERELLLEKQKLESRVKERTHQLQLTNEGLRKEIEKRQRVETELQEYSESLARSNRELEDFAYVASHDLQEPLRKIQAFSNLLESEYAEKLGDGADYLKRMHSAAMRMSTLIQDLLAFSRVNTKTNPAVAVDLNEIVQDVLIDLESRIEEMNGTVKVGELPRVTADPTHMRQLFQNLIGNGLKFHKPDTPSVVTVEADTSRSGVIELRVSDNGIGFDEKYLDRIFSVFQRLHGRDTYDGTGIGLAVCRKIVERYGGTITAKSAKNKGATFIVTLPVKKEKK